MRACRLLSLLGLLFSAACTSDSFVVGADAGGDAGADGDGQPQAPDAGVDAPLVEAGSDGCTESIFYLDSDGDGYGGTSTETACAAPGSQWVSQGGDCDDTNPNVHPNQVSFFTIGYTPTGKSTVSFDYDCDGVETESGSPPNELPGGLARVRRLRLPAGDPVARPGRRRLLW